jgi:hypothetical protein
MHIARFPLTVSLILLAACHQSAKDPSNLSRDQVLTARQQYAVEVVSCDLSQEYGTEFPYSDYVRLRIANHSNLKLPYLTILTKRYDENGVMVGSSRAPSIPIADLKPGQAVEYDYYPRGHLGPVVKKVKVEIEQLIDPDAEKFFPELRTAEH